MFGLARVTELAATRSYTRGAIAWSVSNVGPETGCSVSDFSGFHQSLQANTGIVL